MADLSAITGVTGRKLKEIEGYARSNVKAFGGDAAQSAEAYKLILSQLSPEIAQVPEALKAMGVSVTSKLMGGDAVNSLPGFATNPVVLAEAGIAKAIKKAWKSICRKPIC